MPVLAHAADFAVFGPILVMVTWISIKSLIDQRRDRADNSPGTDG